MTDTLPNRVIVDADVPNRIIIRTGAAASNTRRHVHTQGAASSTWTINHTLGGKPSVTVVDSADTTVVGEITYNSNSQIVITFSVPFSGYAYLT
jgi:hypothetical protein